MATTITRGGSNALGHYEPELIATFLPGCTACGAAQKGPLAGTMCAGCGAPLPASYRRHAAATVNGAGIGMFFLDIGRRLAALAKRI